MILVTGATGFVGRALVDTLVRDGLAVRAGRRRDVAAVSRGVQSVHVGDMSAQTDWTQALDGVDAVIHAAARVHVMHDAATDPLAEYRSVNVQGTLHLARQAVAAGVTRFIFLSSIKVNGEATPAPYLHPLSLVGRECERRAFRADDTPAPQDPYGISKMEAEVGLRTIAAETGMEVVIIRPPLVYGPGVKANFASMVRWLQRGVPLPLGAIDNRRSLVALDNLVDLIIRCIHHPAAANQTFMVSDGEDVSTTELLRKMGAALGRPARLLPVPQSVLEWGAKALGKQDLAQRLFSSLQVDIQPTRNLLGWTPPLTMDEGLAQVARHVQGN